MKEALLDIARYNREANRALVATLKPLDEALLAEDQGSYYKSILGTLAHLAQSESTWLRRFAGFFPYRSLGEAPVMASAPEAVAARAAAGPASVYALLEELDALVLALVAELDEASLGARVKYKNIKGDPFERTYWHTIFHMLNHGTHHRGEISAMLDRKGIANDYGSFTKYTS